MRPPPCSTSLRGRGLKLATAESCTGGLIAGLLTEIAGSSDVVERGFVTYSNAAKAELLGVPEAMLAEHGAVSEPVARAMAEGALASSAGRHRRRRHRRRRPRRRHCRQAGGARAYRGGAQERAGAAPGMPLRRHRARRGAPRRACEAALQLAARVAAEAPAP